MISKTIHEMLVQQVVNKELSVDEVGKLLNQLARYEERVNSPFTSVEAADSGENRQHLQ